MSIKEKQDRLPTLYWLPKLHKRPYKARFIANSSSCTTTVLSKLLPDNWIYPTELQLNRANSSDTEAPFLDLNLCISNGTVSTKIYDKRDDFDFDIDNFPFLD